VTPGGDRKGHSSSLGKLEMLGPPSSVSPGPSRNGNKTKQEKRSNCKWQDLSVARLSSDYLMLSLLLLLLLLLHYIIYLR
jgi:hypothetical protein